jgi:hypothetical protein
MSARDTLAALRQLALDLHDQAAGLELLALEARDGWRVVPPGLLGETLLRADRVYVDLARLVDRLQESG